MSAPTPRWARRRPAPGLVLIALPMLTDPQFARSAVYLLEADPGVGSVGVVITAPTRTPVAQILPDWHEAMSEPSVIFRGGPVQADGALCLAQVPSTDVAMPTPGIRTVRQETSERHPQPDQGAVADPAQAGPDCVGLVDLDGDVLQIRAAARRLRIFAGHAGWGPGQLEDEIAEGAWALVPGRPADVFSSSPTTSWSELLRRQPPPLRLLATYPPDPTAN